MKRRGIAAAVLTGAVAVTAGILSAPLAAQADPSVQDGAALLQAVAPTAIWPSSPTTSISVANASTADGHVMSAKNAQSTAPTVSVATEPTDSSPMSIDFTLDGATGVSNTSGGVTTFATTKPSVARYVSKSPAPFNFHCTFWQEQYLTPNELYPNGDFAFAFDAASGHVDGLGSSISFDWWTGADSPAAGEKMRFTVFADIVNSNPAGVPQSIYEVGAKNTWSHFVSRYVLDAGGADGSWYWTN